jgi:thiamine biosynthesis protein ThiI
VVIDTRPLAQYEPWHYPGAVHHDFWDLFQGLGSLDRDRTYVLYCELGLKSAQLAEKMQRAGFEAYSYKGGVRALRQHVDSAGLLAT